MLQVRIKGDYLEELRVEMGYPTYEQEEVNQESSLALRANQPSKPSVYPLVSCCGAESSTNVDIGCLATGYLPEPVTVAWDQNGSITSGIRTFPAVRHKGSSHYSLSSVLSVSSADWKTKTYKCLVKHEPTNTNTDKTVSSAVCKTATSKPAVQVLQSSCDDLDGNGSIELICLVSGYSPDKIKVQWLRNGETTFLPAYTSPSIKGREGTFSTTSQVNISKSDWILGERYTCKVDHPATNTSLHDSIRNCPEIYMYMEGPPDEEEEGDFDNLWNTAATFIALFLLSVLYGATITLVKVKWFLARLLQYEQEAEFITVLDPVAS
ncbi:hypothetical protein NDU88_003789 [Pleurodeles waltl]|uniref:Ig-like domain-containing protein n=1 Tax=Pleurodeles waltl TaxID=8319 RepID=A0AAV7QE55_PLEWA|nr:hypothetical protein NDU88_003789 [Pleurodeles waltl]